MAKKKESTFKSFEEIDEALKQLGELNIQKQKLEGNQTLLINEIKANTLKKAGDINTQITSLIKDIERFAIQNKAEFIKNRTKKMNYGSISFRLNKKVSFDNADESIKALKALNLYNCIRTKEELDKEVLKECDENILLKAGISIIKEDKVSIEPDYIKLAATKQS